MATEVSSNRGEQLIPADGVGDGLHSGKLRRRTKEVDRLPLQRVCLLCAGKLVRSENFSGRIMNLHERERAGPHVAGLPSPVQQAEMKLLLAGRWPPLKPLPVFKYETDQCRASIDFDKTRGEWVCRKTSLPSNKVQELRGGLTEIIMALPQGRAAAFAECAVAQSPEQELDKDASRRLQAIREWGENYENGALCSGLEGYLSKSQREELYDSLRLTLTARQLQFNPKNVACVFDSLVKAGGKLATLIEIAQRNKTDQGAGAPARAETAVPETEQHSRVGAIQISDPIAAKEPEPEFAGYPPTPVESLIPATLEGSTEEPVGNFAPEQSHPFSTGWIARMAAETLDGPPRSVEPLPDQAEPRVRV
jgi:hypothetical protein